MQKLHDEGRIYYPRHKDGSFDTTKRPAVKRYLNEQEGSIITNAWIDINPLHSSDAERLGYPTQKPLALLERIIQQAVTKIAVSSIHSAVVVLLLRLPRS